MKTLILCLVVLTYFLPSIAAVALNRSDKWKILVYNLAFSWFVIPWFAALEWAIQDKGNPLDYRKLDRKEAKSLREKRHKAAVIACLVWSMLGVLLLYVGNAQVAGEELASVLALPLSWLTTGVLSLVVGCIFVAFLIFALFKRSEYKHLLEQETSKKEENA